MKKSNLVTIVNNIESNSFIIGEIGIMSNEFEDIKSKLKLQYPDSTYVYNLKKKIATFYSEETYNKHLEEQDEKYFKENGTPSYVVLCIKFYNKSIISVPEKYMSYLHLSTDILKSEYRTFKVPFKKHPKFISNIDELDCKIISEVYD